MHPEEPPVIDFGPFYGSDSHAKNKLVQELRQACEQFGFFQLVNHAVPTDLQQQILQQSKDLFGLPLKTKQKYHKDIGGFNRGYESFRSQHFEKQSKGDLKEGYYLGNNLPLTDPYVIERRFGQAPNKYPTEVRDPQQWQRVMEQYHSAMTTLSINLMRVLASTLELSENFFDDFCRHPVAALRLLHYPPQDPATAETERGIGAHTDFGAITILLQDNTGGLQVWNNASSEWVDVTPVPGAYVVNLGNMMMRWTNDRYLSNLHRVINRSEQERFSIPFFFSGNPNFEINCLPSCLDPEKGAKYPPVTVHDWMTGRFADTYGSKEGNAIGDMRQELVDSMAAK